MTVAQLAALFKGGSALSRAPQAIPPPAAQPALAANLNTFSASRVLLNDASADVTDWPVGRTVKEVVTQGDHASAYHRRSWKPSNVGSTDLIAGWQGGSHKIRLKLDDDSEIDLSYTVAHTIPTPAGTGTTRYLDASAAGGGDGTQGTPWNDWTTAIAGLAADDVLVVSAKDGNERYNIDVQTGGPSSSVNGCKIVADPDDIATGRRPILHVQGGKFGQFATVPNSLWEVDPGSTAGFEVYRTKTDSEFSDPVVLAGLYKTGSGGYGALAQYFNDGLNHIRDDDPTARFDPSLVNGRNNQRYLFPGVFWNSVDGRLYVRLDPRPPETTTNPASGEPNPPWDWSEGEAVNTDPNQCELLISSTETDSGGATSGPGRNYAINIDSTTGWEFENIDFVGGGNAIRARSATVEARGCRFFGQIAAEIDDRAGSGSGTVSDGKDAHVLDIQSGTFTLDRSEVWGGFKGWHTNNANVKVHEGHYGLPVRRVLALMRDGASLTLRHTLVDGMLYLVRQSGGTGPRFADLKMRHCRLRNTGQNGATVSPIFSGEFHFLRSELWDGSLFGWTGGSIADPGNCYIGNSLLSNIRPVVQTNGWYASDVSLDNQYYPVSVTVSHGSSTEPEIFARYQCTGLGAHDHHGDNVPGFNYGNGTGLGASSGGNMTSTATYKAYNNIAAVYAASGPGEALNGYSGETHIALLAEPTGVGMNAGQLDWDYNHYFRDDMSAFIPSSGNNFDTFATVVDSGGTANEVADLAGIQANSSFEDNGSEGDPQFSTTPDTTVDDPTWRTLSRWTLQAGSPAASGGNTSLSGQGWPDIDVDDTEFTYDGYVWRGALEPDVPVVEQQIGPLGRLPSVVAPSGTSGDYAQVVLGLGPIAYWRLSNNSTLEDAVE